MKNTRGYRQPYLHFVDCSSDATNEIKTEEYTKKTTIIIIFIKGIFSKQAISLIMNITQCRNLQIDV